MDNSQFTTPCRNCSSQSEPSSIVFDEGGRTIAYVCRICKTEWAIRDRVPQLISAYNKSFDQAMGQIVAKSYV